MYGRMQGAKELGAAGLVFLVWWASWNVLDTLLVWHPWPELGVLCVCAVALSADVAIRRRRRTAPYIRQSEAPALSRDGEQTGHATADTQPAANAAWDKEEGAR